MSFNKTYILKIITILQDVSKIYREYSGDEKPEVFIKEDKTEVTQCDFKIHDLVVGELNSMGVLHISEEDKEEISYEERSKWKEYWVLDPLDGTSSYIRNETSYGTLLGYILEGDPLLGFMYTPKTDICYWAEKGKGAFKIENFSQIDFQGQLDILIDKSQLIRVKYPTDLPYRVLIPNRKDIHHLSYLKELRNKHKNINIARSGACQKYVDMLEGKYHEYCRFTPIYDWDIIGAYRILIEAGFIIKDYDNKEIIFNSPNLLVKPFRILFS